MFFSSVRIIQLSLIISRSFLPFYQFPISLNTHVSAITACSTSEIKIILSQRENSSLIKKVFTSFRIPKAETREEKKKFLLRKLLLLMLVSVGNKKSVLIRWNEFELFYSFLSGRKLLNGSRWIKVF